MASKFWDAGIVALVAQIWSRDYVDTMITHAAGCALWADAEHDDDTEGTGEYASEIDDLRVSYTPDYADALPPDVLAELRSDVEGFVSMAWPYLSSDNITPEQAGHDFQLTRNHHGTGFWDRGYKHGDALTTLAHTFGTFGLMVTGHGEALYDECSVCGEPIVRVVGPVQAPSDEYVHAEAKSDHAADGPIRVYGSHG
jgi:hypothetical protein